MLSVVPLLTLLVASHQPAYAASKSQQELTNEDFIFAAGSCTERMLLAKSTRVWRATPGHIIPAFLLTDNTSSVAVLNKYGAEYREAYGYHPDEGKGENGPEFHGFKQGDTRAALSPFAAHKHYWPKQKYKWLLYGDDDTIFFMDAVKRLLKDYDPEVPYALSDNLWYNGKHPNLHAPRCLPCHTDMSKMPSLQSILTTPYSISWYNKYHKKRGGPSAEEFAAGNTTVYGFRYRPRPACPRCTPAAACGPESELSPKAPKCKIPLAHGGAGMIFSIGLMKALAYDDMYKCFMELKGTSGSDAMVSICLWNAGYAFTDPGTSLEHSYDPHYTVFGGEFGGVALRNPMGEITRGRCGSRCRWLIKNAVSLHLKGRHYYNWQSSAANMYAAVHGVAAAHEYLELKAAHALEGGTVPDEAAGESSSGGGGGGKLRDKEDDD